MELDEFKQLYLRATPEDAGIQSELQLERRLHSRTDSITARIKRSIRFEFAVAVFFLTAAIWAWFAHRSLLSKSFSLITVFLCIFFFTYLGALYKKIQMYETSLPSVKDKLVQVIYILQQFTQLYFQFTMISLPMVFLFGLMTGYWQINNSPGIHTFNWRIAIFLYSGLFLLWWLAMYFFTKWYIRKLYGVYLEQLKLQLKDIENG